MSIMYKVCKRTIERGAAPENMADRIKAFRGANQISVDEYNEQMAMLG